MARNYWENEAVFKDNEFEIDCLNEQLFELLKTPISKLIQNNTHLQSLPDINSSSNKPEDNLQLVSYSESPPGLYQYKNDYSLFHQHGSPVKPQLLQHYLSPIGVFWDIENCRVPKGKSASTVVQAIRDKFFKGYREAEFIVVCDVYKESRQIIQELNDAQVNLIHVPATFKNAADEKLKQTIRRFADTHGSAAAIVVISGDINFAADLSDLRHRKRMHVILLHNDHTSKALIQCANEHYNFKDILDPLPTRTAAEYFKENQTFDVLVSNLPKDKGFKAIKSKLKQLSDNCGGRVVGINSGAAILRFGLQDWADRAQQRMNGAKVFDAKIKVRSLKDKSNRTTEENNLIDLITESANVGGAAVSSPLPMYLPSANIPGVRSLPGTPQYNSSSPVVGAFAGWNGTHSFNSGTLPTPILGRQHQGNGDIYNRQYSETNRTQSPLIWSNQTQHFGRWEDFGPTKRQQKDHGRSTVSHQDNAVSDVGTRDSDNIRRNRSAHSSVNSNQDWNNIPRPNYYQLPVPVSYKPNYPHGNNSKRVSPVPSHQKNLDTGYHSSNVQNFTKPRRSARTPSPYKNISMQASNRQTNASPYLHNDPTKDNDKFFNPINRPGNISGSNNCTSSSVNNSSNNGPIDLQVTNLDQNIDAKTMSRILHSMFSEHVRVEHVGIFMQSDGNYAANVKLSSLSDSQYAISQLHRRKIGFKRILISYGHTGGTNPQIVRSQIIMLLLEVPGYQLPLFKFREMYENRFLMPLSVSELYKMKDVCNVIEDTSGRMVSLNPEFRNSPSPCMENISQGAALELPYCHVHYQKPGGDKGWAEQEIESLPSVMMSLKILGLHIEKLLITHDGNLPLLTLTFCYEAEFNKVLKTTENGVPLEHLISCLNFVEIKQVNSNVKYVFWAKDKIDDYREEIKCASPALVNQLTLFSRELVDLLKTAPHCQILFNKFIPAYHHHFGRQCRVADYGYTKLIDLLEALPTTIQVMGEGNKRTVTLSHRAQIRRFTSDLLRVLKAQASKQVTLTEFPAVYNRVIGKQWDPVDYGVCEIGDILSEVSEHTVAVSDVDGDKLIAIPKRDQNPEEKERTKQFTIDAIELLSHTPHCTMQFNKFVPSYHHHFGHQCRVSDYGFTKLIELFEAIPHVIQIKDVPDGERLISLTEPERFRVLGEQISKLVGQSQGGVLLSNIGQFYSHQFGYILNPEFYECNSMEELMRKLSNVVQIIQTTNGPTVILVDKSQSQVLGLKCRRILMDQCQQRLPVHEFRRIYDKYFGVSCDLSEIRNNLSDIVEFITVNNEEFIGLTALQCFACNLYRVLIKYRGKLNLDLFENAYLNIIGTEVKASHYGFSSINALLQALQCTVTIKETRSKKKMIFLNKQLGTVGIPLPIQLTSPSSDQDSSNESIRSESSQSNYSSVSSRLSAWTANSFPKAWNSNNENKWSQSAQKNSEQWPVIDENGETFLKNIVTRTSSTFMDNLPMGTKTGLSDSINNHEESDSKSESSVWASPPQYVPNTYSTNVDLPPLTLPEWVHDDEDDPTNLLSPAKNLLSAAANPLNPFYSSHAIMAPHPSELPLPSLSLVPKRDLFSDTSKNSDDKVNSCILGNSLEILSPNRSNTTSESSEPSHHTTESESSQIIDSTPKKTVTGKRSKLAAQFNQPIDS
ncbi:meiosis regulator and mRNA stability factor 1 isoform X1 [Microplitis mediator]|uniref:meiosis regulator and mRNA stability factor 1 isoform X1 n=2 Tax=Microplitis mediator TaxID=375433 RepID=UPI0025558C15|nr:meiosis regulator and mRNA stability factor 1 isoform X1 [Microplitis mediator]